ncbi:MAG: RpiB/LacA/LacB family sugar-phosphate isomerase [Bacilli bacterium]|nr:RpiB/LacA/LacB family sugar-phosphate isomerase [Bacilli bacterium]
MKIYIACDHKGVELKNQIINYLTNNGISIIDIGLENHDADDYPDFAFKVCEKVIEDEENLGILICGNGIGMSIAANKVKGIRAARAVTVDDAFKAKNHNGANVLALSSEVDIATTKEIIDTFIITKSATDERFIRRIDKISSYETGNNNEL